MIASQALIDELGLNNPEILKSDDKIETFIVIWAIKDAIFPRLIFNDW